MAVLLIVRENQVGLVPDSPQYVPQFAETEYSKALKIVMTPILKTSMAAAPPAK